MPNTKDSGAKLALYAVGNGQIIIYNDMNLWKGNLYSGYIHPFNL